MKKYIHYGHTSFDKEKFIPIKNRQLFVKPIGGLWASDVKAKFGWKDWCEAEHFRDCKKENSFTFVLSKDAKVLEINSVQQLTCLPQREEPYGFAYTQWVLLDFELLSKIYDAIELNISKDHDLYWKLYGWDCDCILIMNPEIVQVLL